MKNNGPMMKSVNMTVSKTVARKSFPVQVRVGLPNSRYLEVANMTTLADDKEREAFERIERKFKSSNHVEVERAVITKEDLELAKSFIQKTEYEKYF